MKAILLAASEHSQHMVTEQIKIFLSELLYLMNHFKLIDFNSLPLYLSHSFCLTRSFFLSLSPHLSLHLSLSLSLYLSYCLSLYLWLTLPLSLSVSLSLYPILSLSLPLNLNLTLSVSLSLSLSLFSLSYSLSIFPGDALISALKVLLQDSTFAGGRSLEDKRAAAQVLVDRIMQKHQGLEGTVPTWYHTLPYFIFTLLLRYFYTSSLVHHVIHFRFLFGFINLHIMTLPATLSLLLSLFSLLLCHPLFPSLSSSILFLSFLLSLLLSLLPSPPPRRSLSHTTSLFIYTSIIMITFLSWFFLLDSDIHS